MIRFAICNELFEGWCLDDAFQCIGQIGYDAVELAPFTLGDDVGSMPVEDRKRIRNLATVNGLCISGLHWLLASPEGLHLTHPDDGVRIRTREHLRSLIHFCADLGGTRMVFGSPDQRSLVSGDSPVKAWDRARETLNALMPDLNSRGVTLCIESLPGLTDFVTSMSEAMRLVTEVDHPNFQTMVDVKSMCGEGRSFADIIQQAATNLRYVHVNDENLKGPGMGDTDLVPVAAALRDVGYDGYVSVEVFDFSDGAEYIARQSLEYLHSLFEIDGGSGGQINSSL